MSGAGGDALRCWQGGRRRCGATAKCSGAGRRRAAPFPPRMCAGGARGAHGPGTVPEAQLPILLIQRRRARSSLSLLRPCWYLCSFKDGPLKFE